MNVHNNILTLKTDTGLLLLVRVEINNEIVRGYSDNIDVYRVQKGGEKQRIGYVNAKLPNLIYLRDLTKSERLRLKDCLNTINYVRRFLNDTEMFNFYSSIDCSLLTLEETQALRAAGKVAQEALHAALTRHLHLWNFFLPIPLDGSRSVKDQPAEEPAAKIEAPAQDGGQGGKVEPQAPHDTPKQPPFRQGVKAGFFGFVSRFGIFIA